MGPERLTVAESGGGGEAVQRENRNCDEIVHCNLKQENFYL